LNTSSSVRKLLSNSKRLRLYYSIAIMITIALGLASRRFAHQLPDILSDHAGDALWAIMIYIGIRILWVHKSLWFATILSLVFCYLIECSQLYQAVWINDIRHTIIGGLILGKGFLWIDLVRYTIGILIAVILDYTLLKVRRIR